MIENTSNLIKTSSFWKRLLAYLIDAILILILSWLTKMIFRLSEIPYYWFSFGLYYAYNIFMDYYHQGSLGKMILNIKVVKIDGGKPELINSIIRNLAKIISSIPLFYGYLRILAPHQSQTIHDELAKCQVIDLNTKKVKH